MEEPTKMIKPDLPAKHLEDLFGDDWPDYLAQVKSAKTSEELLDVLVNIFDNHGIAPADSAFIFAKVLFTEETFEIISMERDSFMTLNLFKRLQESGQECVPFAFLR